jgi:hypothetical protein
VAGASIKEGDAIDIGYGGGVAGNDRFLQGMFIKKKMFVVTL